MSLLRCSSRFAGVRVLRVSSACANMWTWMRMSSGRMRAWVGASRTLLSMHEPIEVSRQWANQNVWSEIDPTPSRSLVALSTGTTWGAATATATAFAGSQRLKSNCTRLMIQPVLYFMFMRSLFAHSPCLVAAFLTASTAS